MAFNYVAGGATNRDKVRLLIGDTVAATALYQDEELCFFETEFGPDIYNTALAAIDVAMGNVKLANAGGVKSKSVGPLSISRGDRVAELTKARARIEALLARKSAPTPYAGGISTADKDIDESNEDRTHAFRIGEMDNPEGIDSDDFTKLYERDR